VYVCYREKTVDTMNILTTDQQDIEQPPINASSLSLLRQLPKVELHAHLNGCIRPSTLRDLARDRNVSLSSTLFSTSNSTSRTIADCFQVFAAIAQCVTDLSALQRITREALEDFQQQNVVYLELRTTPKRLRKNKNNTGGDDEKEATTLLATKQDYVETVLQVLQEFMDDNGKSGMTCRLILSIDRAQSLDEARDTLELVVRLREESEAARLIVGLDLAGNPTQGEFTTDWQDVFRQGRQAGLKITLHIGEVGCSPDDDDEDDPMYREAQAMLALEPDRLGHALLLPPALHQRLLQAKIPVETCPTSNVMTLGLPEAADDETTTSPRNWRRMVLGLQQQHLLLTEWLAAAHPLAICTDDPGVFDTDATQELVLLQQAMQLTDRQVADLVLRSMEYAFCDDESKKRIQASMQTTIEQLLRASSIQLD
jgi:adenosine deaminase